MTFPLGGNPIARTPVSRRAAAILAARTPTDSARVDQALGPRYHWPMRWPETTRLMDRIREGRPEMTVDFHCTGGEHYCLRLCALKKGPGGTDTLLDYHLVEGSIDTIYGP